MDKFAVFGYPISHSLSPPIYNKLFEINNLEAFYTRINAKNRETLNKIINIIDLKGFNLTSPLKKIFDENCPINTVVNNIENTYFNTDEEYFSTLLNYPQLLNRKNKILIIGNGATASIISKILKQNNYCYDISLRNHSKSHINNNIRLLNINRLNDYILNYDILINTIKQTDEYLDTNLILSNKLIIDLIYKKNIFKNLKENTQYISGLEWLIGQAKISFQHYFPHSQNLELNLSDYHNHILNNSNNIILLGYMGAGKSTIAQHLSSKFNFKFVDIDNEIESLENRTINNIFEKDGEYYFRNLEINILEKVLNQNNQIISVGGGIINNTKFYEITNNRCFRILILRDLNNSYKNIIDSKRPLLNDYNHFKYLFNERIDNYIRNSDLIYYNDKLEKTIEELNLEINNILE